MLNEDKKYYRPIFFKRRQRKLYFLLPALLFALILLWVTSCGNKKIRSHSSQKEDDQIDSKVTTQKNENNSVNPRETSNLTKLDTVYFDFDDAKLREDARKMLKENVEILRKNPNIGVSIEGHCDERGSVEYNLALGEKRAEAIKRYLINLGINSKRLSTISYGEEKPLVAGHNEEVWSQNRRGELSLK